MGKIIRRTVTITTTESWTIVWLPDDDPLCHPTTILQHYPKTQEEPDEALQVTLMTAEPGQPSISEPPLMPVAATFYKRVM